jgi:hypothetical protein
MSDRNEAQTYMANGGQMYASGGITALADGGALPKYKYDPVLQRYTLQDADAAATTAMEEELLRQQRAAQASGGSDSPRAEPSAWDKMSNAEKAAYYAANPTMAKITQMGQNLFGRTGLGQLSAFFDPQAYGEAQAVARGFDPSQTSFGRGAGSLFGLFGSAQEAVPKAGVDVYGYAPVGANTNYGGIFGDYGTTGPGSATGVGVGSTTGLNSYDVMSMSDSPAGGGGGDPSQSYSGGDTTSPSSADTTAADNSGIGGYAYGGLAALARGGISHLGDYSDGGRLLRGPGDGVSDSIPAVIGNKRPARLADGEFVIPARIVSELGNGSTEAGARKLYDMMARIQQGRKKSIGKDRVAVNSRADKNLPA